MDQTRSTLLVRLKDHADQAAWGTFNALYRPLLVGYAVARGLDRTSAEDVAQQCTQVVLERIGEYQHLGSFKSWLRAIADHKVVDLRRRRSREEQLGTNALQETPAEQDTPDDLWNRQWKVAHLRYCAEQVRDQVEEATYAAFYECAVRGAAPATVAARLGMSTNQVYVAKHRILERIRAMIEEMHGPDAFGSVA